MCFMDILTLAGRRVRLQVGVETYWRPEVAGR